jgi:hypothetical protein
MSIDHASAPITGQTVTVVGALRGKAATFDLAAVDAPLATTARDRRSAKPAE